MLGIRMLQGTVFQRSNMAQVPLVLEYMSLFLVFVFLTHNLMNKQQKDIHFPRKLLKILPRTVTFLLNLKCFLLNVNHLSYLPFEHYEILSKCALINVFHL